MTLWLAGVVAVLLSAVPAVAEATEPASKYNTDGQEHNDVCVDSARGPSQARGPFLDLRYLSGLATGFQLLRITPAFDPGGKCALGQIRLDLHEVVAAPSATQPRGVLKDGLVFHRGGSDYVDAENVRYGQLAVSELRGTSPADLAQRTRPSGGNRGAACPTMLDTPYKVSVQPIPSKMKYKSPEMVDDRNNAGASYLHYGDPAAQQGQQIPQQKYLAPSWDPTRQIHYTPLTWSWIDVGGGGENRILLAPGQDIRLCDVEPIDYPSWAPNSEHPEGFVNGQVEARYVETSMGDGPALYGWMVWTHQYYFDDSGNYIGPTAPVVDHFTTG